MQSHEHAEGKWTRIGAGAQVFATIVAAIALIVTASAVTSAQEQNVLATQQLERSSYQAVYSMQTDVEKLVLDKPELIPYICDGQSIEEEASPTKGEMRPTLDVALSFVLDFDNFIYYQINHDGLPMLALGDRPASFNDADIWESWRTWSYTISGSFKGAPDLCGRLQAREKPTLTSLRPP